MVLVSYSGREINAKIVYYGPGLSGKTTNLEYIYGAIPQTHRGKMVSMKTKTERTLFFDFLPIHLGELSGFKTRFLLYTVPGQVYYNATRKLVLKGVDAVVFVADSKRGKMDENLESLENLRANLKEHGLSLDQIPWVIQYNKRDLPDVYTIEELERALNPAKVPSFEAVATTGQGVFETFKTIARMLLKHLSEEIGVRVVPGPEETESAAPDVAPANLEESPAQEARSRELEGPSPPEWSVPAREAEEPLSGEIRAPRVEVKPPAPPSLPPAREPAPAPPPAAAPSAPTSVPASPAPVRIRPAERPTPAAASRAPRAPATPARPSAEAPPAEDASRHPGVGNRLRRWFARPREPEETSLTPEPPAKPARPTRSLPPVVREPRKVDPQARVPLSVSGLAPEVPGGDPEGSDRSERAHEVPIVIDLDPEDLESGIVLTLRIGFRRNSGAETEDAARFLRARAA